eukprot:scaffold56344_cov42-Phaeocystis_antarctica.AAC.1
MGGWAGGLLISHARTTGPARTSAQPEALILFTSRRWGPLQPVLRGLSAGGQVRHVGLPARADDHSNFRRPRKKATQPKKGGHASCSSADAANVVQYPRLGVGAGAGAGAGRVRALAWVQPLAGRGNEWR